MVDDDSRSSGLINARSITALVIVVLLVFWIFANRQDVRVSFIVFRATLPLWAALAIAAVSGGIAGALLHRNRSRRARRT